MVKMYRIWIDSDLSLHRWCEKLSIDELLLAYSQYHFNGKSMWFRSIAEELRRREIPEEQRLEVLLIVGDYLI